MQERQFRSLLFVPGNRPDLIEKARVTEADALVLDLEDAVPSGESAEARASVSSAISGIAAGGKGVYVRVNGFESSEWLDDLLVVTVPGLTGLVLPKVSGPGDITAIERVVALAEQRNGVEPQTVDLQPLLETALGIQRAFAILTSSARIRSYFGGAARDGDVHRELGAVFRRDGRESFMIRSKLLLEGRAAGVPYPISGTWADIEDLDGLRSYAEENRDLGYVGMYVIHPRHVAVVNEAFTPSDEELDWYRRVLDALQEAEAAGRGAATLDGRMIDAAMASRARAILLQHG
jgi:citrate lyase subunit beta/citryl-CoA lyase